jgi:hypothetical protein
VAWNGGACYRPSLAAVLMVHAGGRDSVSSSAPRGDPAPVASFEAWMTPQLSSSWYMMQWTKQTVDSLVKCLGNVERVNLVGFGHNWGLYVSFRHDVRARVCSQGRGRSRSVSAR